MRWRDDFKSDDVATITIPVPAAEDKIKIVDGYVLVILHARSFHGKGFIAQVWRHQSLISSCDEIVLGESEEKYDEANKIGLELLESTITREREEMARVIAESDARAEALKE